MSLLGETEIDALFLERRPLIDVRAPVEFADGAAPGAVNLPLLTDDERHEVGIRYKAEGQDAAIRLGESLVSGETRRRRIEAWAEFIEKNPRAAVYCFRGGLRSQSVARVLHEERGLHVPIIGGGYKAIRRRLLQTLADRSREETFAVVTGRTGSGKTDLLLSLRGFRRVLDLEGLANHRGSAFGRRPEGQPQQADFENRLATEFLLLAHEGEQRSPVVLEDESRVIGMMTLPLPLFERLSASPLVVIEEPMHERVDLLLRFYLNGDYAIVDRDSARLALPALATDMRRCLKAIEKRLGGVRSQQALVMLEDALRVQEQTGAWEQHASWIEFILREYYDPLYDRHIDAQKSRVVFRGTRAEALAYLRERSSDAQAAST